MRYELVFPVSHDQFCYYRFRTYSGRAIKVLTEGVGMCFIGVKNLGYRTKA